MPFTPKMKSKINFKIKSSCRISQPPFVLGNGRSQGRKFMCRNIKTLFNFEPPATEDEIRASALQFVRKLSGFSRPSQANEEAFHRAVVEVSDAARRLLTSLHTHAPSRDREVEAEKAKERSRLRFGQA
jgi:hypothetical protein